MTTSNTAEQSNSFTDQAAHSADNVIKSTQRVTNETLDSLAETVHSLRDQTAPILNRAAGRASALAQLGMDTLRQGTQNVRDKANHASESTVSYIKEEPVKAMLIAAATGATLMALVTLIGRSISSSISRSRDRS